MSQCGDSQNEVLSGRESWGRVVETASMGDGKTCEVTSAETASRTEGLEFDSCENGQCTGSTACSCVCGVVVGNQESLPSCSALDPLPSTDLGICKDLWSSCETTSSSDSTDCKQSKVESVFNPIDDNCYKVGEQISRSCTTMACSVDHVRVPFRVELVLNLVGVNASEWTHFYSQEVSERSERAFAKLLFMATSISELTYPTICFRSLLLTFV